MGHGTLRVLLLFLVLYVLCALITIFRLQAVRSLLFPLLDPTFIYQITIKAVGILVTGSRQTDRTRPDATVDRKRDLTAAKSTPDAPKRAPTPSSGFMFV